MMPPDRTPLIAHVIHRLAVGGLENGLVNLINRLPSESFRHAIVCITEATGFARRIARDDVRIVELRKPPGNSLAIQGRFHRIFRELRPAIVHTRNLGALEAQFAAMLARVPVRIHGEHGWDTADRDGTRARYIAMRKLYSPFVHRYVALSQHIERYLATRVGIDSERIDRICNGVDCGRFRPRPASRSAFAHPPFRDPNLVLVGSVGRLEPVKDQLALARAFVGLLQRQPAARRYLRLVIVGAGSMRPAIDAVLSHHELADLAWLPGERDDVPEVLSALDVFVLPSQAEGISNTILEAMASQLPVIATAVGGNPELVQAGQTGLLVPPNDVEALGAAIDLLATDAPLRARMGSAARASTIASFSLDEMVRRYALLYEREIARRTRRASRDVAGGTGTIDPTTDTTSSCAE
jgi:sugar transferase (PEP-CTERM/EpsH1 system associated)